MLMVPVHFIAGMIWNNGVCRITPVTAPITVSVATDRIQFFYPAFWIMRCLMWWFTGGCQGNRRTWCLKDLVDVDWASKQITVQLDGCMICCTQRPSVMRAEKVKRIRRDADTSSNLGQTTISHRVLPCQTINVWSSETFPNQGQAWCRPKKPDVSGAMPIFQAIWILTGNDWSHRSCNAKHVP